MSEQSDNQSEQSTKLSRYGPTKVIV